MPTCNTSYSDAKRKRNGVLTKAIREAAVACLVKITGADVSTVILDLLKHEWKELDTDRETGAALKLLLCSCREILNQTRSVKPKVSKGSRVGLGDGEGGGEQEGKAERDKMGQGQGAGAQEVGEEREEAEGGQREGDQEGDQEGGQGRGQVVGQERGGLDRQTTHFGSQRAHLIQVLLAKSGFSYKFLKEEGFEIGKSKYSQLRSSFKAHVPLSDILDSKK